MPRNGRQSLGPEDSLHPKASKKLGPQSHSCKKMHSANNLNELERVSFTNHASRRECNPVDILITAL